tara:strand:+ start:304 stop:510 length:207 start_codon:yes stop_codon:yes gene_type:complete
MDKTKWKSITLNVEDYHAVRGISFKKNRKFSGTITKLINDYIKNVAEDQSLNYEKFKKEMIKVSKNGG